MLPLLMMWYMATELLTSCRISEVLYSKEVYVVQYDISAFEARPHIITMIGIKQSSFILSMSRFGILCFDCGLIQRLIGAVNVSVIVMNSHLHQIFYSSQTVDLFSQVIFSEHCHDNYGQGFFAVIKAKRLVWMGSPVGQHPNPKNVLLFGGLHFIGMSITTLFRARDAT